MAQSQHWSSMIALVDMNAFFASIEQANNPLLSGKPVAITNGLVGTCIITSSYEARAFGIHTGMRLREAKQLCPQLIQRPANPVLYAKVSTYIMESLHEFTPDFEIFSVDEAFLDLTHCQNLWGGPETVGRLIKQKVFDCSGVRCSVGISGDKTTAKYAAKLHKPDGLTLIPPWEARERLVSVAVTELCGVNKGIGAFLAKRGAFTCGDVTRLPISVLAQRFGNPGRRIWYMCQGADPDRVETNIKAPKSIGHGKVVPPNTRDKNTVYMYLIHMAEKVAGRLRSNAMQAQKYFIGFKCQDGWLGDKLKTTFPTNDSKPIIKLCKRILYHYWQGQGIFQVQVTALDPHSYKGQIDFFGEDTSRRYQLNRAMDLINERYGEFTVAPMPLLDRSTMPNVIAPAWKPYGHRQTIPDTRPKQGTQATKKVYRLNSD